MGIPGAVGFFASHYKFSFSRPRLRSPPPPPDTAAGLISSGPSQQSTPEGALSAFLAGQAAGRRPWKAAASQLLRGCLVWTQTPPQARVPAVRPASPLTCTWPPPLEPSPGAATYLPVCLSTAPFPKSTPTRRRFAMAVVRERGRRSGPVLWAGRPQGSGSCARRVAWGQGWPCWG